VGIYKNLAEKAILDIQSRNKVPFLVGGTGMYFNSLYFGLFSAPPRNESIRKKLEETISQNGISYLYEELKKVDPVSASKISSNDRRRIIRALEVYQLTGKPISQLQQNNQKIPFKWLILYIDVDRKKLYERINNRVEEMLKKGLIEETRDIIKKFGSDAYALGSIGYRQVKEYLNGKLSFEEMKELIKKETRNYAKRQITWFKKIPNIIFVKPENLEEIEDLIKKFLES